MTPWVFGIAAAACLVAFSILVLYTSFFPEGGKIPIEDFTIWADIEDPARELRKLGPSELTMAARVLKVDLSSILSNAGLLNSRLSMLMSKPELRDLAKSNLSIRVNEFVKELKTTVGKLSNTPSTAIFQEVLASLEKHISDGELIFSDLNEIQHKRGGVVETYLTPLTRASERLIKSLRELKSNIEGYVRVLLITSPSQSEGQSTEASSNLTIT